MEQIFRIEIPVEAIDKTDAAALQRLETALQKIINGMKQNRTAATEAFDAIDRAAASTASSLQRVESANADVADSYDDVGSAASDAGSDQTAAASEAESANTRLEDSVSGVGEAYEETASAAAEAGERSGSAFNSASTGADRFTQRVERTNQTLRGMFKEKFKLIMEALDKASPILKNIWNSAKNLVSRTWSVAVRMKDFITAPFRKLYNWISSPITIALSVAGVGLSASDLVTTYNDFETGMSAVKSLSGATNEEFIQLKQTAKDLGATTAFSASEASEGMQYLAMAGWDTNEIIAAMPGLLDLAAAGATDLGAAADIVSDVMTAMGMEANEASRAADVFAKAATSSNTTVEMLGETMKYAAPIAHTFGMSLEEVSALAGMMANAGIKGSQAGTALRASLLRMSKPTTDMQKTMTELGISFTDANGNMKKTGDIVRMLEKSFTGLSESQRLEAAQTLFGTEAASAWLGILDQGADTYESFAEQLNNAKGAADEMAKTRLDNLAGDLEEMGGALETAKLEIMDKLNPYLREGVQWLTTKIPTIQEKIEQLIDSGISKAKQLKEFLSGVFNGADFQNADGFADKFFVAWDKIIAEPFNDWWNGGGQEIMLGAISKFGKSAGELLNGIVTGVFAALKGEEIDFEGMNITGIAKAGAQMAKEFVSAFMSGLDFGDLAGKMPGLMKAGMIGFGALKVGSGAFSVVKTFGQLKAAFGGVTSAAAAAAPAVQTVGTTAAASAVGIGKASVILGGLKTALAAIPVWGWVAAATLVALGAGYAIYKNAQARHEQDLLHAGDKVQDAATAYETSAKRVNDAVGTIQDIKEVKLKIANYDSENQDRITQLKAELAGIENREVWLTARLSDTSLTESDIAAYNTELKEIKDRKAYIEAQLASGTLTAEEVTTYQSELDKLNGREVELEAALAAGTLTPSDIAAYQAELDKLKSRKVEIQAELAASSVTPEAIQTYAGQLAVLQSREEEIKVALASGTLTAEEAAAYESELEIIKSREEKLSVKLEGLGLTTAGIALASSLMGSIDGKKAEVSVILSETSLTKDQIESYTTELSGIYTREAEIELTLAGSSLSEAEVKQYKEALEGVKSRSVEIEAKIAEGGLTEAEIASLSKEYESLKTKEAAITLMLSGQSLTEAQIKEIAGEYDRLEDRRAEINAELNEAGLSIDELKELSDAMMTIGDKTAVLNFSFAGGSLKTEDLQAYNAQLEELYGNLIDLSGGQITQDDVNAGRVTEERQQQVSDTLATEANTKLIELETSLVQSRQLIPELVERRGEYQQQYEVDKAVQDSLSTARGNLMQLEADRANLVAQDDLQYARRRSGEITSDQYDTWYEETFMPGIQGIQERYTNEVAPYAIDNYGLPLVSQGIPAFDWLLDGSYFGSLLGTIQDAETRASNTTESNNADYIKYNDQLKGIYGGEVSLLTGKTFEGTAQAGMSLEEIAASYSELDSVGQQLFQDAVMALQQLNAQTDYLAESDKTQPVEVVEIAAKAEVMQQVQQQVQAVTTQYTAMTAEEQAAFAASEEGVAALESVNAALEALGADKISSLDELNTALETLNGIDLSSFSLVDAQEAFVALGGDASGCKTQVDSLRTSLKALDGTSATTTLTNNTYNNTYNSSHTRSFGSLMKNANGGIYDGAMLSWVAEDGPEAIIPLGAKRRDRGIDLWLQAGEMLGVAEFADGGILSPYSSAIENLPDVVWDDGDGDSKPKPIQTTGGGGSNSFSVSVAANPVFQIEGGESTDDILDKLKGKQKELAEIFGNAIAEQLEDIVANMV